MTREEAAKILDEWVGIGAVGEDSHICFESDLDDVESALNTAISALREHPQWISVNDRLPNSQADVLVVAFWHECWQPMIGWHSEKGKKWRVLTPHGEREPGGVTHWMPLPKPPKEE